MKKERIVKPEMPVSPKSVDESKIVEVGKFWTYIDSIRRFYSGIIVAVGIAFIFVIIGLFITADSVIGGLLLCLFGIIIGLILFLL
ncbi:MAG: hypothetical protein LUI60_07925 [Clostridia bacterium]|nr:hypothetical protein [Clostridia bacterium]